MGVGLNRRFDLNSGCLRSSGAWGMGEHVSLEAQYSEFLRDERAVRALDAFEACDTVLSNSGGHGAVAGRGGANTPLQSKSRDEWGSSAHGTAESPECSTSPRHVITDDTVSLSKESSDSVPSVPPAVHRCHWRCQAGSAAASGARRT